MEGPGRLPSSSLKSLACLCCFFCCCCFLLWVSFFILYSGYFCWTYCTWMGLLTLFLITDLGSHLPLGFKDGQGPILQLRVLCSDNGTCKVEPNGSCHGSSSSHLWDARSLTCVSSWFRQQSICCLTCEYSWQGPESTGITRSEWSHSWGKYCTVCGWSDSTPKDGRGRPESPDYFHHICQKPGPCLWV